MSRQGRWPGFVYDEGEEPDYRFSFANERTFLAWIRTGLGLLAAGVVLDAVNESISADLQTAMSALLAGSAIVCAVFAWVHWARSERAMRCDEPLPSSPVGPLIVVVLVVVAGIALVAML